MKEKSAYHPSSSQGVGTKTALLCIAVIFILSLSVLSFAYMNFPQLDE